MRHTDSISNHAMRSEYFGKKVCYFTLKMKEHVFYHLTEIFFWTEVPYTRVEQGTYRAAFVTMECNVNTLSRSFLRCRYAWVALSCSYLR